MIELSQNVSAYLIIVRPANFLITFFTGMVAVIICSKSNYFFDTAFLTGLSAALTASAGNIINDIFDIEIDKINRPDRPLASGLISKIDAVRFYIFLVILSFVISYFINLNALLIVVASNIMLILYSKYLKRIQLLGNVIVASLTGLVFIFGGVATDNLSTAIIPSIFAFLINLIREVVKDMEDVQGDGRAGIITFPIKYGNQKSKIMILIITFSLILFTGYPFVRQLYKIEYFILVMVIVNPILIYSLKSLFDSQSRKNLNKISNLLKLSMVFGLIAIYLGV